MHIEYGISIKTQTCECFDKHLQQLVSENDGLRRTLRDAHKHVKENAMVNADMNAVSNRENVRLAEQLTALQRTVRDKTAKLDLLGKRSG